MPRRRRPEQAYEGIKVLDLARQAHLEELAELFLSPAEEASAASYATLEAVLASGCKAAVVEDGYVDRDHARSYTRFYAQAFQDVSKRTTRVHFFSARLTRRSLDALDSKRFQTAYGGFCVLRPPPVRRVGRTILAPRLPSLDVHFPLAVSTYDICLAGTPFRVRGAPYQEQDARVASCASAAIWMSGESMAPRFNLPSLTTAEITDLATRHGAGERVIPSGGLRPHQMGDAFVAMGYEPVIHWIDSREDAMQGVYPYVESGLAPILLLRLATGRHAVVAVGHTYDAALTPRARVAVPWRGESLRFWQSWQWADAFLIHDDQRGAYRRLEFVDRATVEKEMTSIYGPQARALVRDWRCPVRIDMSLPLLTERLEAAPPWPGAEYGDLYGAIAPLPPGISLSAEEAAEKVAGILRIWYDCREQAIPPNLYLRSYLARAAEFKQRMSSTPDVHPFVRSLYRGKNLPRWIWVTEVGFKEDLAKASVDEQRIRGEILIDTNSSPWTPDFLALHMPFRRNLGHLSTMRADQTSYEQAHDALAYGGWMLYGDAPYKPLLR